MHHVAVLLIPINKSSFYCLAFHIMTTPTEDKPEAIQAPPIEQPTVSPYSKPCTLCSKPRDVLVRCIIDESLKWHFVCVGKCWKQVSGGKIDGDGTLDHQFYRYGG